MATKKTGKKRGKKAAKKTTKKRGKKGGKKARRSGRKATKKPRKAKKKVTKGKVKKRKAGKKKTVRSPFLPGSAPIIERPQDTEVKEIKTPGSNPTTFKASGGKKAIKDFLTRNQVKFEIVKHSPAFTAQQVAASAHIPGKNLAKTVIIKIDGKLAMVVEPAHMKVNLDALKRQLNAQRVDVATEAEFRSKFPECEVGAMPPFGKLYNMDVFVSDNLSHTDEISFNAGTHAELIKMSYQDFFKLVKPKIVYA